MRKLLYIVCGLSSALAASAAEPRYVSTPEVQLEFEALNGEATDVVVWVSTDRRQTWGPAAAERIGTYTISCKELSDGWHDFYVVLSNEHGDSAPPPVSGSEACATVVVDTAPPTIQLHDYKQVTRDSGEKRIRLNSSLIEENFAADGTRVFFRDADSNWRDGGAAVSDGDYLLWSPPGFVAGSIEICVLVADKAGNRSRSAPLTIELAARVPLSELVDEGHLPQCLMYGTLVPAEVLRNTGTEPIEPDEPDPSVDVDPAELEQLRSLAAQFVQQGRFALAAARFADALALAPYDPDLLVDSGSVLYRLREYEDAHDRFAQALELQPNHIGALDGLALVAATQKRYAPARDYLRQLLVLTPDSGLVWLRSGDIEHRLGNALDATAAWQRAIKAADTTDEIRARAQRRLEQFQHWLPPGTPEESKRSEYDETDESPSDDRRLRR